jgi:hypothetical protein
MELQQAIQQALEELPEERLREVLDFARFVGQARDEEQWRNHGRDQFARAYGPNEPEYSESDLKPEPDA